jgi:hypothetical protein
MSQEQQACPDCGASFEAPDNYCRQCGMYLAALRALEPVRPQSRAIEPARPGLPAPVKKAVTAIAIGTALQIGVGLAGKYLASQAARQATGAVVRPKLARRSNRPEKAVARPNPPVSDAAAVSETLMIRRVWIRRD